MAELLEKEYPLIVIVHHDIAKVLGQTLYALLGYKKDVVCIDSVQVDNGDYIDIGKPIAGGYCPSSLKLSCLTNRVVLGRRSFCDFKNQIVWSNLPI